MKIYLAGLYETAFTHMNRHRDVFEDGYNYDHVLESYYYIRGSRTLKRLREDGKKVFLDSGAFTMFTKGEEVDLDSYISFMQENDDIIDVASNLDHIGRNGEKKTYENQKALESNGVKICPVHHARDDDRWLIKYLDEGYNYIFLGGMVPESTPYLKTWLDRVWSKYLVKDDGTPRVKIHGFGLTTEYLIFRYPWYSIDSTRWVMAAANGTLLFDLGHRFLCFAVSENSPQRKKRGAHLFTLPSAEKDLLLKQIEEYGFDADKLATDYRWRWKWNIEYYKRITKKARTRLDIKRAKELF